MKTTTGQKLECDYCGGHGYVFLLLGGTETCPECRGSGKKENSGSA